LSTSETQSDPFGVAVDAGIHRLSVPTPFAVGRVNVYLIEDDPLTLVDAGPNSGSSLDVLQGELAKHGRTIEDIERVLITHQHIDHIGLVNIVASHSGAEVMALDLLVPFVENYSEAAAEDDAFAASMMLRHGIPPDVVQALQSVSLAFRAWGARAHVTTTIRAGETIEFANRRLEVAYRPGHSPTDTVFLDAERRMLIGGDHLLGHISSNPLLSRLVGSTERPKSLVTYLDSLGKTREMDIDVVLPGHGDPITDHRGLIDERRRLHERRADKIYGLVVEKPRTAHEIALAMWGNIAVTQAYLTLSEVVGHLDLLIDDGRVVEVEQDDVAHFVTAE
jgi:glyoxylase-like metal-dependent hydrolase (beta-lactamase superfamily II)